jgi:dTDP-4-dehydrorhamnose 3,5-epimerase
VYEDGRGFFYEAWNQTRFEAVIGLSPRFVQDNHSRSSRGVIRGLHYQVEPSAQGKLVRVAHGSIFDVAVDIRRSSETFGHWFGTELSGTNLHQLWIPGGFAHGFLSLKDGTDVVYKATSHYSPEHDRTIRWDDPRIGIEWPIEEEPMISDKDSGAPPLIDAEVFD